MKGSEECFAENEANGTKDKRVHNSSQKMWYRIGDKSQGCDLRLKGVRCLIIHPSQLKLLPSNRWGDDTTGISKSADAMHVANVYSGPAKVLPSCAIA